MELEEHGGNHLFCADIPNYIGGDDRNALKVAVTKKALGKYTNRGRRWYLGQLYGIVGPSLIMTKCIFQGLEREMYVQDDKHADTKKLIFCIKPNNDYKLEGSAQNCTLAMYEPPEDRVFVVYVSINENMDQYPEIHGWAEHWTWIHSDIDNPYLPYNYQNRYKREIWRSPNF